MTVSHISEAIEVLLNGDARSEVQARLAQLRDLCALVDSQQHERRRQMAKLEQFLELTPERIVDKIAERKADCAVAQDSNGRIVTGTAAQILSLSKIKYATAATDAEVKVRITAWQKIVEYLRVSGPAKVATIRADLGLSYTAVSIELNKRKNLFRKLEGNRWELIEPENGPVEGP